MYKNLYEFACLCYDICRPAIINIPTNGLLVKRIPEIARRIAAYCERTDIVINVSIDEIGEAHDHIRGVEGSFDKAVATFKNLKSLAASNLSVGIHTVISRYNVNNIHRIYDALRSLNPDSYVTEIAEERVELGTIGLGISPDKESYGKAVDYLTGRLKKDRFNRVGSIARAFRIEYYDLVKRILEEKRQVIPCYAGVASAQIAPDGDVWMCCVQAKTVGSLRENNYDFSKIWFSERAKEMRLEIKTGQCYCPLANASYTNILHHSGSLFRVASNMTKSG